MRRFERLLVYLLRRTDLAIGRARRAARRGPLRRLRPINPWVVLALAGAALLGVIATARWIDNPDPAARETLDYFTARGYECMRAEAKTTGTALKSWTCGRSEQGVVLSIDIDESENLVKRAVGTVDQTAIDPPRRDEVQSFITTFTGQPQFPYSQFGDWYSSHLEEGGSTLGGLELLKIDPFGKIVHMSFQGGRG